MTRPATAGRADQPASERVAVLQPLPGIGDMVWHMPHLQALARTATSGRVTVITKPRSAADRLLAGDPCVETVLWLDRNPGGNPGRHDGPRGFARFVRDLRRERFDRLYILHHSARYAFAAKLAGIPERFGYGYGGQRRFLTGPPFLPESLRTTHPIDEATAFVDLLGLEMDDREPRLTPTADAIAAIERRFGDRPHPWLALGLGSSETFKQWGPDRFAALARTLAADGWPTCFLVGGPSESDFGPTVQQAMGEWAGHAVPAFDLGIDQVVALLSRCALYVGNDTGVLNVAAAAGTPALGLFGGTEPLSYSRRITAILPADGRFSPDGGMQRIALTEW